MYLANQFDDLISIIVPVYNSERTLRECAFSILDQDYRNIEVIFVNDGSTDRSIDILSVLSADDERVRVIYIPNRGVSFARNLGVRESSGKYIAFVDADDCLEKGAITALYKSYRMNPETDLVIGNFLVKNNSNGFQKSSLFQDNILTSDQEIVAQILQYLMKPTGYAPFNYVWGKLFRASIIKESSILFDESLLVYEDIVFNISYLGHVRAVTISSSLVYDYHIN